MRLDSNADPFKPPLGISYVGHGNFRETGQWYVDQFVQIGGMRPNARVLDIGCGVGRMAVPLLGQLENGSYEGFDISSSMIKWCQKNITTVNDEFRFTSAPVYNQKYNPFGSIPANEFRFPYESSEFDFAFAVSVFTHLGIEDAKSYLAEIERVLRPGGKALLSFFLLDSEDRPVEDRTTTDSRVTSDERTPAFEFSHEFGPLRTTDPREPEAAVGYPVGLLRSVVESIGLEIQDPITYGRWPQKAVGHDIQDIVVLRKPS